MNPCWQLEKCMVCPRECGANRLQQFGFCGGRALPKVAKAMLHFWEEPCISGENGSGAVFFSGCALRCVYCQNYEISHEQFGREITITHLAKLFEHLQEQGAHNINLVNPTHYIPQIAQALQLAQLHIPVIYNCGGYEKVTSLQSLNGLIDIYLPDLKYFDAQTAKRYSAVEDYFIVATKAILEMQKQVGKAILDDDGIMQKGLLIRHLVLPGLQSESIAILDWISQHLPHDTMLSIMGQYVPMGKAQKYPELNRTLTEQEYDQVLQYLFSLDLENGFVQDLSSAQSEYTPDFDLSGIDF